MGKISSLIGKEFDCEPVYGDSDKCIKTKIKTYGDKVNTNFHGKRNINRKCIIPMFITDNFRFCY